MGIWIQIPIIEENYGSRINVKDSYCVALPIQVTKSSKINLLY